MTFLPIVGRELRVASRRRATYWSRVVLAVGAILVGLFTYLNTSNEPPFQIGQEMFQVLSVLAFIYCMCVGVRSTADCLSEEKREGTLGLLFLTDLKGYDVVGGKLVAGSLNSFYGLCAIIPVLAIPLLMGGVTNGEFWRMALVLGNTFFFSLAIGMFVSSISKYPRRAISVTIILLLFFSLGLPFCDSWMSIVYKSSNLDLICKACTPETAFAFASDAEYKTGKESFWLSVSAIFAMSGILLGLASFIVPRSWQDHPPGEKVQRARDNWHRLSFGDPEERRAFRARLLDINAFFWLAARVRIKPAHVWAALIGIGCLWTWGAVDNGSAWINTFVYFITAIVLNSMLKIWVASEAGRQLGEDRKIGALELLLSTPLTVPDILRGQMLALRRQFFGPVVVVLLVETVFLLATVRGNRDDFDSVGACVAYGLTMMFMLVADCLAISVVAMWISLTARNPNRSTGAAIRRILVLPWAIIIVVIMLVSLMNMFTQSAVSGWGSFLVLYIVVSLTVNAYFGVTAWQRLHTEFRSVAVERFSIKPSFWSRMSAGRSTTSSPSATT